jgi:hypothetical protein
VCKPMRTRTTPSAGHGCLNRDRWIITDAKMASLARANATKEGVSLGVNLVAVVLRKYADILTLYPIPVQLDFPP